MVIPVDAGIKICTVIPVDGGIKINMAIPVDVCINTPNPQFCRKFLELLRYPLGHAYIRRD